MMIYDKDVLPMIEDDNGCETVVEGVVIVGPLGEGVVEEVIVEEAVVPRVDSKQINATIKPLFSFKYNCFIINYKFELMNV